MRQHSTHNSAKVAHTLVKLELKSQMKCLIMLGYTLWTCDCMRVKAGMRSRVAQAGREAGRHHQQSTDDDDRDESSTDIVSGSKYWKHS